MELRRLTRIAQARWGVVLAGAAVGLAGAFVFLWLSKPSGVSLYEATASMRFDPGEGQTIPDLADEIRAAREFALIAAEDLLVDDPTAQIVANLAEAKLEFVAVNSSQIEAEREARALLQSYLNVDPTIGAGVDDQLLQLEAEAEDLQSSIDELEPTLTPEDQQLISQQTQLEAAIVLLSQRLVELVLADAAANDQDTRSAIASERARLEVSLASLQEERANLGPVPEPELDTTDALLLATLQRRMELLNTEYQRLYLRKLGVIGQGIAEPVTFVDLSSDPIPPPIVVLIGMLGGALVTAAGLLVLSRTRKTVWLPEDLSIPVLGQIPSRPADTPSSGPWYDTAEPGARKTAVQALRSSVQAQAPSSGAVIAFTGCGASSEDVQALAADLAGSMASAGDSVLLIDANYASHYPVGAYRVAGTSLTEILRTNPDAPEFDAIVETAVERAFVVRPGLAIIPSGATPGSPADALAGRQFRSVIASASTRYDVTIVVVDDIETPSAQAAMQRVTHGIIVTTPGVVTQTELDTALIDAQRLRIHIAGAVFVGRGDRHGNKTPSEEPAPRVEGNSPREPEQPQTSPMTRLYHYSIPDERRSAVVTHSPLGELTDSLTTTGDQLTISVSENLGADLLRALDSAPADRSYEAVADYVVARAEDMVTARYGYGDLPESLIHDVAESGFLPLSPVRNHKTLGTWLIEEIESEVEPDKRREVVTRLVETLSDGTSEAGIDDWLEREFFRRHLSRSEGSPEVWHLVSPERSVSLLVPARRLNANTIEDILSDVVTSSVDELERKRKDATARSDLDRAAVYEQSIWDTRIFEQRIKDLIGGSQNGRSKKTAKPYWSPNWSAGTRANLAPFQFHGLLPFDVLSDEEMSEMLASSA